MYGFKLQYPNNQIEQPHYWPLKRAKIVTRTKSYKIYKILAVLERGNNILISGVIN